MLTVTFTLTDNQPGDGSGTIGLIVDPSGLAESKAAPAPLLSFWGLAAVLALLLARAWFALRRRSVPGGTGPS